MIPATVVRESLSKLSVAKAGLLDAARWAIACDEVDDDILSIYTAPAFVEARLDRPGGETGIVEDFRKLAIACGDNDLELIGSALSLGMPALKHGLDSLATQLLARLPERSEGWISVLRRNVEHDYPSAARPLRTDLLGAEHRIAIHPLAQTGIEGFACGPDGQILAILDARGHVGFAAVGSDRIELLASIRCEGAQALGFTPSGTRLRVKGETGRFWTIDVASRTIICQIDAPREYRGMVVLDEDRVLTQCDDGVYVVDGGTGIALFSVGQDDGLEAFTEATVAPRAALILIGSIDGRVDAFSLADGSFVRRIGWFGPFREGREGRAETMMRALFGGGGWVVGGDDEAQRSRLSDLLSDMPEIDPDQRRAFLREFSQPQHLHAISDLAVSSDETIIAASSLSGEFKLWDLQSSAPKGWWLGERGDAAAIALDADGDHVFLARNHDILVWSRTLQAPETSLPFADSQPEILLCPQGRQLLLGGRNDGAVIVWPIDRMQSTPADRGTQSPVVHIACERDGTRAWAVARNGRIEEWDLRHAARLSQRDAPADGIRCLALSGNGKRMAICTREGVAALDNATGLTLYRRSCANWRTTDDIRALAVSDDGRRVLVARHRDGISGMAAQDGTLELVEMDSGKITYVETAAGRISNVQLASGGRFALATMAMDRLSTKLAFSNRTCLWDLDASPITRIDVSSNRDVSCVVRAWPPGLLWVDEQDLIEDDLPLGNPKRIASVPECRMMTLSSDESCISMVGIDGVVTLWGRDGRRVEGGFRADERVVSVAVVPADRRLAVLDSSGFLHVLDVPALEPLAGIPHAPAPDSLATALDVVGSADILRNAERLAGRADATAIFRVGLARRLARLGHRVHALSLLAGKSAGDDALAERVDCLIELGAEDVLADLSGGADDPDRDDVPALTRAAEWLAANGGTADLARIAAEPNAPLRRLVAALALADQDEATASEAFVALGRAYDMADDVRLAALVSIAELRPANSWLDLVGALAGSISASLRRALANEAVRRSLPVPLAVTEGGLQPTTVPFRRSITCNDEAMRLAALGDFAGAHEAATQAIRRSPRAARYYHTRGMIALAAARAVVPGDGPSRTHPGRDHFEQAIKDLSEAIARDRAFDAAWSQRGYARLELGHYELGLADITEAIALSDRPGAADFKNRAKCLHNLGRHAEAGEDELQAVRVADADDGRWLVHGKARAGDDPGIGEARWIAPPGATRKLLVSLGELDRVEADLVATLRGPDGPLAHVSIIELLGALQAEPRVRRLVEDSSLDAEVRVAAAGQLLERGYDKDLLITLSTIAQSEAELLDARCSAARVVQSHGSPDAVVTLLRNIRDVATSEEGAQDGVRVGLYLLKSLSPSTFPVAALEGLVRDGNAHPMVREMAAEVTAVMFDRTIGIRMLRELAADLPSGHPVRKLTANALAHMSGDTPVEPKAPRRPEQIAFDAFMAARNVEDIDDLTSKFRLMLDPDFLDQLDALAVRMHPDERQLFDAKLDRLRSLPPDIELLGFRAFARCGSLEEVREVAERYPFLTTPTYHEYVEHIITDTTDAKEQPAFRRRLEWLRQIPADPQQIALHAFVTSETSEELRAAVSAHPLLAHHAFPDLCASSLRSSPEWPIFAARLAELKAIVPPDAKRTAFDRALDHLTSDEPEAALAALKDADEGIGNMILKAQALLLVGREEEAIEAFGAAIDRHPSAMAFRGRGKAYMHLRRPEAALADFSKSLELDPGNTEALEGRGFAYALLENVEASLADLDAAERLGGDLFLIYTMRAGQHLATGNLADAAADYRKAIAVKPEEPELRLLLAKLLWHGPDHEDAERLLEEARQSGDAAILAQIAELELEDSQSYAAETDEYGLGPLLAARSQDELRAAMAANPALYDSHMIDAIERLASDSPPDLAAAIRERLPDLKRLAENAAQHALDLIMNARTGAQFVAARERQPLLHNEDFLAEIERLAGEIEEPQGAEHLRRALETFRQ